ncbi:hypothetical protein C3747_84g86 [Trypanosoma cruzi]|uniref:Uncharacterized protein n=2 Tax=Trypanosoma cruzi TaxID=5693 RepID=Q4CV40_TRYCC|nr:hypothetical protein, conserved [Trypanosoma cruzi]EAN84142.1 hypothetical protein, conserved [Trypanosoma cruzi]KAF5221007.1 hypothetical protein ECC02_006024 [Trypanosoma cruzi]PWV08948.1 hypothetical protein C3747_84g86 [Trypanosoma cruzi]|eukprot:XP_805993.1 hypothetical protein [Trypanosoma cruzi strain CL Brener]
MSTPLSREGKRSVHKPTATRDKLTATTPLRMSLRRKEIPEEKERGPLRMSKLTAICPTRSTVSRLSAVPLMNNRRPPSSIGSATVSTTPVARPAAGSRLTTRRSTVKKSPRVTQSLRGQSSVHDDSPEPAAPISSVVAVNTMPLVTFSPSVDTGPRSLGTKTQSKADVGQYNVPFTIKGPYVRVAVVRASASIWAANGETGTIDVYSSVSGLLSTRIPARTTASGEIIKPTALKETPTHLWVGYDDGSVVVHDHLCLVPLTMGCFHKAPVIAFCVLSNGITVSGSSDMAFVRWDTEEKNFEAISRIFGVSELHQGLTCMAAFGANIVLCGSMSGAIVAVDCASGLQIATLRGHANRVNALTLMGNLIFSASEDGYVNVWNVKVDETFPEVMLQKNFYLLKCIPLQVAVRDLVIHEGSRSLWVAYADGLVERWSANPDDDFGVEQVVRGTFVDVDESQEHQQQRQEVISLDCIRNVDTMRVLALGSNGISKVWCGLRNTVEESLQQAINDMNAIITQDTTEAAAWEQKALILREKEVQRKEKYGGLLTRLHARRLLLAYYTKWRARINFNRLRGRQQEEICLTLEERHQFRLVRRYFSIWCEFYDREQRRFRRQLTAAALERLSHQTWVVRLLFRWRGVVSRRKALRRQGEIVKAFARVSNGLILGKFFTRWKCYDAMRRGVLPEEKLALLVGKSRQRVLRQAYEDWKMSYASRGQNAVGASVAPAATGAVTKSSNRAACAAGFAEAYAKVTIERGRRRVFSAWRRWHEYRCGIVSLRALAIVREKQCQRNILYRALLFWQLFCRKRRFEKLSQDVEEVEKRLRHAEETHVDIFDKLQLQKRLEQLRRQQEEDQRLLHEEITRTEELNADREVLRRLLDRSGCIDDDATARASSALFSPAVLKQLPIGEAMAFVMARMKGMVLNIYTDIQLFRQIKDRLRCGTTAAVIFLEGFQEVKRLVVTFSKKQSVNVWRSGERWPLTAEILENLPLHPCATVVQGIKTMVVAYDMVGAADIETVSGTRAEIVTNADLLFMLWRACYTARKPPLPVNNRVSSRF